MEINEKNFNIVSSKFSLIYPRNSLIRRKANEFEDAFCEKYLAPSVLPVPDEIEPEMPRILLGSKNGHSQISVSQISLELNVNYTNDYIKEYSLCENYLLDRTNIILHTLKSIKLENILYIGLSTFIEIPLDITDDKILQHIVDKLSKSTFKDLHDFHQKLTFILSDEYYLNIGVSNYRKYSSSEEQYPTMTFSISNAKVVERGILVSIDINNRYRFNKFGDSLPKESIISERDLLFQTTKEMISKGVVQLLNEGVLKDGIVCNAK